MPPIEEDPSALRQLLDGLRTELARHRQQARSHALARVAVGQLDVDPERALLLALEANAAAVTFDSRDALQQAVSASRLRWLFSKPVEARILHAYFAKDNRHIITAGQDSALRWWDREAQIEVDALSCGDGPVEGFQLSPGRDRILLTARDSRSGKYRRTIVDLSERRVLTTIDDDSLAQDDATQCNVFFSRCGHRVILHSLQAYDLSVWDSTSGTRLFHAANVGCHGVDADGRRALVTRADCSVVVLHLEGDGRPTLLELPKEYVTVSGLCDLNAGPLPFSSDGSRVTAGTSDRVACVWDANDGRLLHILGHECPCHRSIASFTLSGHYVIVQQYDSVEAEVWEAGTGKMQCRLPHSSAFHVPLRYLPFPAQAGAAEYAVVGMGASDYSWPLRVNMVSEWRIATGETCSEFRLPGKQSFQRVPTDEGTIIHWAQRAEQDDISLDADWALRLEEGVVRAFARVEAQEAPEPSTEQGSSCTADRRIVFTAEGQRLLDTVTDQALALFGPQDQCRLSQNGRHLVTIAIVENKPVVRLWDARTGELRFTITDYSQPIVNMHFQSGPARLLIFARDHTVRLWSLETGREVARATINAPDESWYEAASTPDGSRVAFVTSGQLHVWHTNQGLIVHARTTLYAKDPRFSADGSWLLAGDEDVARIWDSTTMEVMCEFPWHFSSILFGDLAPDRKLAATYGMDNYIRMWEAPGGREITRWKTSGRHSRWPLRFSEDGAFLYCPDGRRRIVGVERLISLAKTRGFRTLSPVERRLFLGERET